MTRGGARRAGVVAPRKSTTPSDGPIPQSSARPQAGAVPNLNRDAQHTALPVLPPVEPKKSYCL